MNRDAFLGLSVLSIALLACGGGNSNSNANSGGSSGEWTIVIDKDFGEDAYKFPKVFAIQAKKHGCDVSLKDEGSGAVCSDGTAVMLRQGTKITVGCKQMSQSDCKALVSAIINEK